MPKLNTLKALARELQKERYDLAGYRLVVEEYETQEILHIDAIELDHEGKKAVFVAKKKEEEA